MLSKELITSFRADNSLKDKLCKLALGLKEQLTMLIIRATIDLGYQWGGCFGVTCDQGKNPIFSSAGK